MGRSIHRVTFILLLGLAHLIAGETHHKRNPLGFQGVRGKRSIGDGNGDASTSSTSDSSSTELIKLNNENLSSNNNNNQINGDVSVTLRPDDNTDQMTNNDFHDPNYYHGFPTLSLHKRAPSGFMGMRGKKDFEYTDYHKRAMLMELKDAMDRNLLLNYPIRYVPKRAPSGFMGMRGKKLYEDGYYSPDPKRAPSGFMGMRGKKDNSNQNAATNLLNVDLTNFENDLELYEYLQAERQLMNEILNSHGVTSNEELYSSEGFEKRAPSGFMGMRGKKMYFDGGEIVGDDDDAEGSDVMGKRDPSGSGFFGMRGKKSSSIDDDIHFGDDKRVPMGFQGMRGKKDISNVLTSEELEAFKRAPAAGFFGMRGKKQPMGSGFFGMRGKKGPYEFRDKFVGVRGKKVLNPRIRQLQSDADLQEELIPAIMVDAGYNTDKRVPSGFYGVRGKKWSESP